MKSEGIVKKHQADVLGVYRMVDSYNERPVYKQDGGENYIYYRLDNLNEPIITPDSVPPATPGLLEQLLVISMGG